MQAFSSQEAIEKPFLQLCAEEGRRGVIGFVPAEGVRLLPEQEYYLRGRLRNLAKIDQVSAVSLGLCYHASEILAVPASWRAVADEDDSWHEYARAQRELNRLLNHTSAVLAEEFGGVAEQATLQGLAEQIDQVDKYFPTCVSHRAFAEGAGVGWRGRHGLIVTPEVGSALRLATVFFPDSFRRRPQQLAGCGECRACLDVCPVLKTGCDYQQICHQRMVALGLEDHVCGVCVRVCWDQVGQ